MSNIIKIADQTGDKALEILRFSLAKKLNTSVECVFDSILINASALMANVPDGYVLYRDDGMTRAALVLNMEILGLMFPFVFHADDGESDPVGLLYADLEHACLGQFIDYIGHDENLHLFHSVARYIPATLNGIGVIQAIHNAKQEKVAYYDDLGIRRVCKFTKAQLQRNCG